jgi:hypothetical protein
MRGLYGTIWRRPDATYPSRAMSHDAPARRRTGTVRRGDLPSGPPPATQRTGWALGAVLLAAVALLVGWVLGGGGGSGSTAPPTATAPSVGATSVASAGRTPTIPVPSSTELAVGVTPGATDRPVPTATEQATPEPSEPAAATESAAPDPTERPTPTVTEPPTPEPTPMVGLAIDFPADGEVVTTRRINLIGTAAPGATITRDIPLWFDEHAVADEDGLWLLPVELSPGENRFLLRVGDDRSTERVIRVLYQPAT